MSEDEEISNIVDLFRQVSLRQQEAADLQQTAIERLQAYRSADRAAGRRSPPAAIPSAPSAESVSSGPTIWGPWGTTVRQARATTPPHDFVIGDHVYILNSISHVRFRRETLKDRAAVVYKTTEDKIHIRTYNGHETWRKPSNLRRLTKRERENVRTNDA